ncbi:BlpC ABC transporter [Streptococcus equi subsp. zooepidemicus]|nr:BlpC ABC transporter [Streptococcus equi subsp. zooepidemicus]
MNPNLFRSAEFYQRRYHNFATILIIPLTLFVIFLLSFSFLGQKEVTVSSRGEIMPTKVIASIQSTSNNAIVKNNLKENQLVKKGKRLIKYKETIESSQKNSLESQLNTLNKQKVGLETLKESLKQGTNFLPQDDEFGLADTFNNFMNQSQEIKLGIAKINTEVSNQSTLANNTLAAIDTQINTINQQISEYEDLRQAISNHNTILPTGNPHQDILNNYLSQSQEEQTSTSNQFISQINQTISGLESSLSGLSIQRAGTGSSATYDNSSETKVEVLRTQFLQNASQQLSTIDSQITELKAQLEQASV